jgi:hypothetical protein
MGKISQTVTSVANVPLFVNKKNLLKMGTVIKQEKEENYELVIPNGDRNQLLSAEVTVKDEGDENDSL